MTDLQTDIVCPGDIPEPGCGVGVDFQRAIPEESGV